MDTLKTAILAALLAISSPLIAAEAININTAGKAELMAVRGIGEKRAEAIIAYREQFVTDNPGRIAFTQPADLTSVTGIGPATVSQIEPFLIFPSTPPPTSQPL